jgi:very-short-patch-repair endonuclease
MWAAVLYAGAGAVVSHATAAHAIGWSATPEVVDVIVPVARRVRDQPSLRIHRCSLEPHDIAHVRRLPSTAPMRTVLDLMCGARTADDALGIAANSVGSRRVSAHRLVAGLRDRPNARHRAVLLDALQDVAAGSDSILEVKFAQLLRRHGLAPGTRQQRMRHGERTIRVDMAWPGLVVELDGLLGHAHYAGRFRDAGRDNAHTLAGRSVLRFGWSDVTTNGCKVAAQVAALLGTTRRRCGPECAPT